MVQTILIVEDDELNMKLFNDLLESHGFKTVQSIDGVNTMELAREHHPDLILMDIQLPKVSGLDLIKALRVDPEVKHIPILAVTAFAMKGDKEMIIDAGSDGYISKPISVPHFLEEVKKHLTMGVFRLIDSLKTGHAIIDGEHQGLAVLLNEVMDLIGTDDNQGYQNKMNEICVSIKTHFEHEEKLMEELGFDGFAAHKSDHVSILQSLEVLKQDIERDSYKGDFTDRLTSILVHDMIRADIGFTKYLNR